MKILSDILFMEKISSDSWDTWKNHVLKELERLNDHHKSISEKIDVLQTHVTTLNVKSRLGTWIAGLIGGGVMSLILSLIEKKG